MPQNVAAHHSADSLVDFALRHGQIRTNLCSRQHWETGYNLPLRTVSDYNFIYVTRGTVAWDINGKLYELAPRHLVFVRPDTPHRAFSRTRSMTLLSIHVELILPGGRDALALLSPPEHLLVTGESELDGYLRGALAEYDRPDFARTGEMLPGWAHLVTIEFLRFCQQHSLLRPQTLTPVVAEMLRHLHERSSEDISLDRLAKYAGYTPQHLNRLFHRELGTTPLKHLMTLRLERAARLLDEGVLTVAAIGRQCGFADAAYFSRVFRKRYGTSPAGYQKTRGSESPSLSS